VTINNHIKKYILSNLVEEKSRKIGIELECIFYDGNLNRIPVNPCNQFSATDLLNAIQHTEIINRKGVTTSLEPGGQIEWGSTPFINLHDIHDQLEMFMETLLKVASHHGLFLADYAMDPLYNPTEVELIDFKKYHLMHDRFMLIGQHGQWMMRCSNSVQVNIDLTSETDAEEMAFIVDCITPIISLLFSNSPFAAGEISGDKNLRYCIWNETDPVRTGFLLDHGIAEPKNLLNDLCEYITTVPSIFSLDKENHYEAFDGTLGDRLEGLEASGELKQSDILTALHQIFTHVRFKNVIEVRGMDRPPRGYEMAPVALWTGILMVSETRKEIMEILEKWSVNDRKTLRKTVEKIDITQLGPNGKTLEDWIRTFCKLAITGLKIRSEQFKWDNEDKYLKPYLNLIDSNGILSQSIQEEFRKTDASLRTFIINRITNE
jgi:glutamate--cysteine ligase